jgi:hypothetical protein
VQGVQGEASSYLWYVKSLARSLSMHSKVPERRIMSIVWTDSDINVDTLIAVNHGLTIYRVCYNKAWRTKEHALALLWGDWREAYTKVPKLLNAI